jgi:hypothetical protein
MPIALELLVVRGAIAVLCCIAMGFAFAAAVSGARQPVEASQSKVLLGAGKVRHFRWSVSALSSGRRYAAKRPCLRLNVRSVPPEEIEIPLGEERCGSVHPFLNIDVADGLEKPPVGFLVVAFPRRAATVSLYFRGAMRDKTIPLTLLSKEQSRKTGLAPFRYFVLAFSGRSCLSRFVTHSATGAVLDAGERMGCGFR